MFNPDVIRSRDNPLLESDGLAVLTGNLAPAGAVIKPAAMEPQLRRHSGPAVVFRDYNDMAARIDSPDLPVTKDSVIVLQSAGPQGAPGMPEWGQLPIPKKLLKEGVRDMLRISDARMSGTSYGACVLHVALMRASLMRSMSRLPCLSSFTGIGIIPHSGMPGPPLGPALRSTITWSSVTSAFSSSSIFFMLG